MQKVLKAIMILAIIVLVGIILVTIDYSRIQHLDKPIFSIPNSVGVYKDGGTVKYLRLGYKIIDFIILNGYDEIKVGTWFMQYSDFGQEIENNNMSATIKAINEAFTVRIKFSIDENDEASITETNGIIDATNQSIANGEIILFTGVYGGFTTKANANTLKGKYVDRYGNVYDYKIPCDENEEMLVPVNEIDKSIVEKYTAEYLYTLSKEELDRILNNMKNVSG